MGPEFEHEQSKEFLAYWRSLNDGHMPSYRLWDPIQIPRLTPWCTIIERGGETGYRHRFAGTAICDFYNEEMTGKPIGYRMDEEARAFYFADIEKLLTRPCGRIFTVQARSETGRDCLFETISVPLADDDGVGFRFVNHQVIIEEITYGEAKSRFSLPDVAYWFDIGAGVPEG